MDATRRGNQQRKFARAAAVQAQFDSGSATNKKPTDLSKYLFSETTVRSPASFEALVPGIDEPVLLHTAPRSYSPCRS